jgi:hypothetical protein
LGAGQLRREPFGGRHVTGLGGLVMACRFTALCSAARTMGGKPFQVERYIGPN